MATIQYVNTTNYPGDTEVEVHRPTCGHLDKFKRNRLLWAEGEAGIGVAETAKDAWTEYNSDFIAEAEEAGEDVDSAAWSVDVFPCTGLVPQRVTVTSTFDGRQRRTADV